MDGFFNSEADGPHSAHGHSPQSFPTQGGESQGATDASAYGARALSKSRCEAVNPVLRIHKDRSHTESDSIDTFSVITAPESLDAFFLPLTMQSDTIMEPTPVVQNHDNRHFSAPAAMQPA